MKAGGFITSITPKSGTHLGGSIGGYRASELVMDPLNARAVIFESGEMRLCFLSLDVTIITRQYTDKIRHGAAERYGLDPRAIMVHATQTHSAPSMGHFMVDDEFPNIPPEKQFLRGGDLEFADYAAERAIEAIGGALQRLEPVTIDSLTGELAEFTHNRRAVMRDGKVTMPWFYSTREFPTGRNDIRYIEGPTDPEVGVLCARNAEGKIVVALLSYTAHPVNQFAKPGAVVSADWPGAWAREIRSLLGEQCTPLVLNGCCGNINPVPAFVPDFVPDHARMGHALGQRAKNILSGMKFRETDDLDFLTRDIQLPVREIEPAILEEAKRRLETNPEPPWLKNPPNLIDPDWCRAAWIYSIELLRQRSPEISYEIQIFRIGTTAYVGLPGEPFVEGQLAIKLASPFYPTQVVHCTTQYIAYFPTREAYPRGGHEVFFCKVAPGSLEQIVESAGQFLQEMAARQK
ncbi:neutral/alkaline non-lysosomal ceramidase N-terminal domain-containing protein [soil metagenome]